MRTVRELAGRAARDGGPRPQMTPLGRAIARYGNAVPVAVLHAVNTVTPERLAELRLAERRAELDRKAGAARRARLDRIAMEEEAREWRW